MKALSVREPWAALIIRGAPMFKAVDNGDGSQRVELAGLMLKDCENRDRKTNYRGKLLIHASKREVKFEDTLDYLTSLGISIYSCLMLSSPNYAPRGAILGEVELVDCRFRCGDTNANLFSPWHEIGKWGWYFANPKPYASPIPYSGQLGLFEVQL